jgi:hypothetical protein
MADQIEQVSTTGLVDTKQQPSAAKRRQYSEALKRQMVAEGNRLRSRASLRSPARCTSSVSGGRARQNSLNDLQ